MLALVLLIVYYYCLEKSELVVLKQNLDELLHPYGQTATCFLLKIAR